MNQLHQFQTLKTNYHEPSLNLSIDDLKITFQLLNLYENKILKQPRISVRTFS